jgi:hypothetical protein
MGVFSPTDGSFKNASEDVLILIPTSGMVPKTKHALNRPPSRPADASGISGPITSSNQSGTCAGPSALRVEACSVGQGSVVGIIGPTISPSQAYRRIAANSRSQSNLRPIICLQQVAPFAAAHFFLFLCVGLKLRVSGRLMP